MSDSFKPNLVGSDGTTAGGTPLSTSQSGQPSGPEPQSANAPSTIKKEPTSVDASSFPVGTSTSAESSSSKEKPLLVAADVTTLAQFALLRATYKEIEAAKQAAHAKEAAEREARMAQPGWTRKDEASFGHWGFPNQSLFKWALLELSADFKSAHAGDNQLAKFKVAKGREWFDDHRDLITRIEVYILMRFGASKKVNEDGIASYMSIESVHNLWIMCRHLINHYESLERYEKGQATQALKNLTQRIMLKYKLKERKSLTLPGISDIPFWSDFWYRFPKDQSLRDLCQFDLSSNVSGGESSTANVDDGALVMTVGLGAPFLRWEPDKSSPEPSHADVFEALAAAKDA